MVIFRAKKNSMIQRFVNSFSLSYFSLSIVLIFSSCIGDIEDKNPDTTKSANDSGLVIPFDGISSIHPIANDKVEIFFRPAPGEIENLTYVISHDKLFNPITFDAVNLTTDFKGELRVVVSNLEIDNNYTFNVEVKNNVTGALSMSGVSETIRTFSNLTANFNGVLNVRSPAGISGLDSLVVEWAPAEKIGVFTPYEQDPDQYVITVINGDMLNPGDMNNTIYSEPLRMIYYADSTQLSQTVTGLEPDTPYYIQVRAMHHGYKDLGHMPSYKMEKNTKYIEASTLTDDLSAINVDLSDVRADIAPGIAGLQAIDLNWGNVVGAIDHFRVYYHTFGEDTSPNFFTYMNRDNFCNGQESGNPNIYCKKIDFTSTYTRITDLAALTEYQFHVAICQNNFCDHPDLMFMPVTAETSPNMAMFSGLIEVLPARSYLALDHLYLSIFEPNFESGIIDGLIVEVKAGSPGYAVDTYLNHPLEDLNSGSLEVQYFEPGNTTELVVDGVNFLTSVPYCFSVFPYIFTNDGIEINRNPDVTRCATPTIAPPSPNEFSGIASLFVDDISNSIFLNWDLPTGGIYDSFVVFIRADGGVFNFLDAVAGDPDYIRVTLSPTRQTYSLLFLPDGVYEVGVLSFFSGTGEYSDLFTSEENVYRVEFSGGD